MIRGIHHVAVHVHDLDKMIKFYEDAFGFQKADDGFEWENVPMFDEIMGVPNSAGRGQMLKCGTIYLEMFEFSNPKPDITTPKKPTDKGYTHFCVDVTDIEEEFERLKGCGMTFVHPHPLNPGHVKSIYGKDPEGNIIEIQQTADHCDFRLDKLNVTRA